MKRLITICIAVIVAALVAAPAFAEVQNVKVSGDVKVMGIYRDNFDLNDNAVTDQEAWYESIARVQIDADLTDNVSTCVRFLNERDWDDEGSGDTQVDLDLASITMKELFYAPLTVIIGRQELKYGSGLVVGDPDRNDASAEGDITAKNYSARKAFDAIRGIVELDNVTIDMFTAKIDEGVGDSGASPGQDIDLYGIDVSGTFADAAVAGYIVYANDNKPVADSTNEEILTIGARGAMALTDALDGSLEVAIQTGDYNAARDQKALALDAAIDYAMDLNMSPVLGLAYSYRSGQKAGTTTGDQEAWTPLYEDQTNGLIADYLFDGLNDGVNSNCHIINIGVALEPIEDLTASVGYYQYILDEKFAAGAYTGGNFTNNPTMKADDDLGSEVDIVLNYAYTEDVAFGLTSAWFMPGDAFDGANDDTATEVVGSVSVSF